jgi:hypothetical protein
MARQREDGGQGIDELLCAVSIPIRSSGSAHEAALP